MIRFYSMLEGYPALAKKILSAGAETSPRGHKTRELLGATFSIDDVSESLPRWTGRKVSLPFAAVEAAQLVAGASTPSLLLRINPTMEQFLEPDKYTGWRQHGAYGPRIKPYVGRAVEKLIADRDTRQAILTIWSPRLDYRQTPDVPCTLSLHFMIRDDKLTLNVTMRSNDLWWGTAYDVFQFTQLQTSVADVLGIEPGMYIHHANSLHLYERDWERADALVPGRIPSKPTALPYGLACGATTIDTMQTRANIVLNYAANRHELTAPWTGSYNVDWYYRHLTYVSPRATETGVWRAEGVE